MSADTQTDAKTGGRPILEPWQSGVIGGILGGLLSGVLLSVRLPEFLENQLPQLYGLGVDAGVLGWIVHVSHLTILGVVFVALVELTSLDARLDDNLENAVAGLAYGAIVWALLIAVITPVWLGAVADVDLSMPLVEVPAVVAYLAYGAVLGLTYSVLTD